MPFFLVSHTSLVEADDARAAAEQAIGALRAGCKVTVAVKSDDANISRLTVPELRHGYDDGARQSMIIPDALAPGIEEQTGNDREPESAGSGHPRLILCSVTVAAVVLAALAFFVR